MQELGKLEDLPQQYRDDLKALNLVPLWPSLRAVLPPKVTASSMAMQPPWAMYWVVGWAASPNKVTRP